MVTTDPDQALAAASAGGRVVLVLAPTDPPFFLPDDLAGRVAVLVGDPSDPAVRQAAYDMGNELFPTVR